MRFNARVKALERPIRQARLHEDEVQRVVFQSLIGELNLATSTCMRIREKDGSLFELLHLDGNASHLTEEQMQAFVDQFPIR